MAGVYYGVSHLKLGRLKFLKPCNCDENPYKKPTYFITTVTQSHTTDIVSIRIQCDLCERFNSQNIAYMHLKEEDLGF